MDNPRNFKYSPSHEWVRVENGTVLVGITDHAQKELGDLVFINLPAPGDTVRKGEAFADVESVKAVSDIISPVDGIIEAVNEELQDRPELINQDPYGAWIARVQDAAGLDGLLSAEEYEQLLKNGG